MQNERNPAVFFLERQSCQILAGGKSEGRADQELSFDSANWNCLLDVKVEMVSRQLLRGGRAEKNTQYLWSSSRVPNSVCVLNTYIYSAHLHGTLIRDYSAST